MELDCPPYIVNVLVFCDHFMRHIMAYVTPDQTAKTVAKFLWKGYILIFRALAKLLSDWGATFESNIIIELCEFMGIWKVRTFPYHPQTNGPTKHWCRWLGNWVRIRKQTGLSICQSWCMLAIPWDQLPQDTAHTIWCLGDDCACLSTYFPTIVSTEKQQCVNHYVAALRAWLHGAFKEAQSQSTSEAERQWWYYNCKANADLVLAKADAYKGRRKVNDLWEEGLYDVECRIAEGISSYLMKNQWTGYSSVLHQNWLLFITPVMGAPLCSGVLWGCRMYGCRM